MESLPIQGTVLSQLSGEAYEKAIQRLFYLSVLKAKYVVFPAAYADIPLVLAYATPQVPQLEIAVKGGGAHSSTWASSEGGIVIDPAKLNKVTVSKDRQSIFVQGGAIWGDVRTMQTRECRGHWRLRLVCGVAGFMLGGGYSPMSGEHSLTIDNLLAATVVLANGRIVTTSATEEPNLFWSIRGGGGQIGIVVDITLKAFLSKGPFTFGALAYPGSEVANVLSVLQPTVLILPWITRDGDPQAALSPFRDGDIKPLVDKTTTADDMFTISYSGDARLAVAPRRIVPCGAAFSDFWAEMVLGVWDRWHRFTEDNEDVRESAISWDLTLPDKVAELLERWRQNVRNPHFWAVVQGRKPASDEATRKFATETASFIRETNTRKSGKDLGVFINVAQGNRKG